MAAFRFAHRALSALCGIGPSLPPGIAAAALGLALWAAAPGTAQAAVPPAQRQALVDLYNATGGPGWTDHGNWLTGDPCDDAWFGVFCGAGNATVEGLSLPGNQLAGSLTPLTDLPDLQTIDISNNQLTGPIPAFTGLSQLTSFAAAGNQFSGAFPDLSGTPGLTYFTVDGGSQLSGPLPALNGLTGLAIFNANGNLLTGGIPSLSGLSALQYFAVDGNQLTGPAPDLSGLASLQQILLRGNQLTGAAPVAPASLTAAGSSLCPNRFTPGTGSANDLAWNAATGSTPWWSACAPPVPPAVTPVPTLGEAALVGLALMLLAVAARRLRPEGPAQD